MTDTMKITFELELADNPPLYQDLVKFPKGTRRVNRLRTLAHAGLMSQFSVPRQPQEGNVPSAPADSIMTEASLELFGPAVDDR